MNRIIPTSRQMALMVYPQQAAVGRIVPKTKIYQRRGANRRLKELFTNQVEQIVWAYKLAPETIRLPERPGVPEIQVFSLQLKTADLHPDVLRCIDRSIPFPILFELTSDTQVQVVAAYKRPSLSGGEADACRWVLSDYFATDWLPMTTERTALPVALHLGGLYEQLLHQLLPLAVRPEETLDELVARVAEAQATLRELDKAAARLGKEKQFNRRVEINATVRQLTAELKHLIQ